MLRFLDRAGRRFDIYFVTTAPPLTTEAWSWVTSVSRLAVRRWNRARDWGSWKTGLRVISHALFDARLPQRQRNGPIFPLSRWIASVADSPGALYEMLAREGSTYRLELMER